MGDRQVAPLTKTSVVRIKRELLEEQAHASVAVLRAPASTIPERIAARDALMRAAMAYVEAATRPSVALRKTIEAERRRASGEGRRFYGP
jgi:hypothetical protein